MTTGRVPKPGDPDYVSVEMATRLELDRRAEYNSRPDVIAKGLADAKAEERSQAEKNARRKRPRLIQTTDYPWLKPGWVDPPVVPLRLRSGPVGPSETGS